MVITISRFKVLKRPFFALLISITCWGILEAQQVHTFVDRDSVRVGDPITLSVVIEGSYSGLSYPTAESFRGDFELLSRERFQLSARKDSLVFKLQYFGVEDVTIPRQDLTMIVNERDTTLQTSAVPLFFKSTLAEDDDQFRPFKPIFDFARNWWPYILALIALLLAGWYLYKQYQKRKAAAPAEPPPFQPDPFINPLDTLKSQLSDLKMMAAENDEKQYEQFYIQLGDAIRLYLKRVYEFQALEMTTGEIITHLQREHVSSEILKSTKKVLYEADLVKFANFTPDQQALENALATGQAFMQTAETIDYERIDYLKYKHEEKEADRLKAHSDKYETEPAKPEVES